MKYELEKNYIIEMLKCAITNTTPPTPDKNLDWDVIFNYAKNHRILPVLYFSIQKLPYECKTQVSKIKHYELAYKSNLVDDANRENEISKIKKLLSKNNIDFILLKGSVTKLFYPDTSMRMMSDIDILYRNADLKEIKTLMEQVGYTQTKSTPKDAMYLSSNQLVKIEMQQSLIDDGFTDWLKYLDTIWSRCKNKSDCEYTMSYDDFYIYHIVHMAKHFINGGIGLRHILDTWVINNHLKEIDREYIDNVLSSLSLAKFEQRINNLCKYWFEEDTSLYDEGIDLLSEYVFENGAFGNIAQQSVNEASSKNSSSIQKKLFPSKEMLANYYGENIINHPITIPYYWIRLNTKRLFKNTQKSRRKLKSMSNISDRQKENTKKLFDMCGLKI